MKTNLKSYIKAKLQLLSDFNIKVTKKQREHFYTLQNEIQVDNYAHDIIFQGDASPWERSFDNHPNIYSAPVKQSRAMRF